MVLVGYLADIDLAKTPSSTPPPTPLDADTKKVSFATTVAVHPIEPVAHAAKHHDNNDDDDDDDDDAIPEGSLTLDMLDELDDHDSGPSPSPQ